MTVTSAGLRRLHHLCIGLAAAVVCSVALTAQAHAIRLGTSQLYFSYDGDRGAGCVSVNEPADPHGWSDNILCGSILPAGTRWSHQGPIPGLRCTQIDEPSDPSTWNDNYLCVPLEAKIGFIWSHRGQPSMNRRSACAPWQEPADPHTWTDNVLCAVPLSNFERDLVGSVIPRDTGPSRREAILREELEQERQRRYELERDLTEARLELESREVVRPDRPSVERRNVIVPR